MLEDVLRESLARQAGSVITPAPGELADRIVRRVRRHRHQQMIGLVVVVVVLATVAGVGLTYPVGTNRRAPATDGGLTAASGSRTDLLGGHWMEEAPASRTRTPLRLPVDVFAADRLVTTAGESIDLSFAGAVSRAYRVAGGWLVVGAAETGGSSLWFVSLAGEPQAVLSKVDGLAVAGDGQRMAWRAGQLLSYGTVNAGMVKVIRRTSIQDAGTPVGFTGSGVLLSRGMGGYDVWWPDRGDYLPTWHPSAVMVYGTLADGHTIVAQILTRIDPANGTGVPLRRWCLALLDAAAELTLRRSVCDLGLTAQSSGAVSPDGRWLVADAADRAVLVDLTALAEGQLRTVSAGPALEGEPAWLDRRTVVHSVASGTLVQLRVDELETSHPDGVEQLKLSADFPPQAEVQVVPRLG